MCTNARVSLCVVRSVGVLVVPHYNPVCGALCDCFEGEDGVDLQSPRSFNCIDHIISNAAAQKINAPENLREVISCRLCWFLLVAAKRNKASVLQ